MKRMKYIKTFEYHSDLISNSVFYEVPEGEPTIFEPSFGVKRGNTKFYQLRIDNKPVVEIEVNPKSDYGKPEIMSAYSSIRGKGLGELLVKMVLNIYLKDEVFVRATKTSKKFWQRCGAEVVNNLDPYLLHFTKN